MDIVFMGTPDFAVPCLECALSDGNNIITVFTQPDKPKGRGNILTSSPVKIKALERNIPVFQPVSLKNDEVAETISSFSPDIIVVAAYGKILPKTILSIPKYGCVNLHASLLPKYRGAAPIQWAVINGDKETGVTSMLMDEGLDTGDMLLSKKTLVGANETSGELYIKLSFLAAEVMSETLKEISDGNLNPVKQDETMASYAPMLEKSLCKINWNESALGVHNLIRGLAPFLYATTRIDERQIRIISSKLYGAAKGKAGEVIANEDNLVVVCGDDCAIEITSIQAEGKRAMPPREYLRGNRIEKGTNMTN